MNSINVNNPLIFGVIAVFFATNIFFAVIPTATADSNLLDLVDQLDKMDEQDFQILLNKADDCTIVRNFSCSEKQLRKAAKLAKGSKNKKALSRSTQNLQSEKNRVNDEIRARAEEERQIRLARERREAEEIAEAEREEERLRTAQREQDESSSSTINYGLSFMQGFNDALNVQNNLGKIQNDALRDINRITQERQAKADADRQAAAELRAQENDKIRQQNQATRRAQDQQARLERQTRLQEQEQARLKLAQAQIKTRADAEEASAKLAYEREQEHQQKLARQQEEKNKKKKSQEMAEKEAAKLAAQKAEKVARETYLKDIASGIQFRAITCIGGDGKFYASGTMRRIKPEVVSLIDVHYRAYCPGSTAYISGIAHNFQGVPGCFTGDTYEISPKPPCKVDQVRIQVIKVVSGEN